MEVVTVIICWASTPTGGVYETVGQNGDLSRANKGSGQKITPRTRVREEKGVSPAGTISLQLPVLVETHMTRISVFGFLLHKFTVFFIGALWSLSKAQQHFREECVFRCLPRQTVS